MKSVCDVKVIPSEECVTQHKLVVCDVLLKLPPVQTMKPFVPKLRCWKLKDPSVKETFSETFTSKLASADTIDSSVDEIWSKLKSTLLNTTEEVCGKSKKGAWRKETW